MNYLKQVLSIIALLAIVLVACKKDDNSPTCTDGIQNGTETGIDCGGPCTACGSAASCNDGIQNGDETGIDCGGSCNACATCTDGIQNGDETGVDCGGPDCAACAICGDSVTDADGNVYQIVEINGRCWTKSNLKTTRLNDNTLMTNVTDNSQWNSLPGSFYSNYNNSSSNTSTYGLLYNKVAVSSGKLCPLGWHIPTPDEYADMVTFLGGESSAGNKLKSNSNLWEDPHPDDDNSSGFTAEPAGYRGPNNAGFHHLGRFAYFWSRSPDGSALGFIGLSGIVGSVQIYSGGVIDNYPGYSCRCVND